MKMLTVLKKEITWLNEINSQSLQHSLVQLDKAFKSFFKHNTAYPAFRSKKDKQYFIISSGFKAIGNKLIIPEFTPVEIPLAGYLSREGISHVSLKQEPPTL
jgi:putative transposase